VTTLSKAEQVEREEHQEKLAKIYLAGGRNETYASNYKDALHRYKKVANLKVSREPELLNEFSPVWLRVDDYEAVPPFRRTH
jgi:hypothetical protein